MLGRVIYENTKKDIHEHATLFTKQLREQILRETSLYRAVKKAGTIGNDYHGEIYTTVFKRLRDIGENAVSYYAPELDAATQTQAVDLALDEIVHSKYYGLTLPQRLRQSRLNLQLSIRRSAAVGAKHDTRLLNVTRVLTDSYPFGAQQSWDTRLFLAEAVRMEHIIAKNIASRKAYKLVRWTLSHSHARPDVCDKLAEAVDDHVVAYLKHETIDVDPTGVYFLEHSPPIPHPNCQCVLKYVFKTPKGKKKKPEQRLNLIQRLIKQIFG